MTCKQAIEAAKSKAKSTGWDYVVWRCGEEFDIEREDYGFPFDNPKLPVRPVAIYRPDGTELR